MSSAGVMVAKSIENDIGYHVKTATTRKIRDGEDENSYTWMRPRHWYETKKKYRTNLIKEYDLLESDAHDGNFYGLPRVNLAEALNEHQNDEKTPILRMEINGARRIMDLFGQDYNILVVGIKPDSEKGFERAIRHRENLSDEEIDVRVKEAIQKQDLNDNFAHFTLTNIWGEDNLIRTISALCELIKNIIEN